MNEPADYLMEKGEKYKKGGYKISPAGMEESG
jgi:hypothetical protein